MSEIFMLILFYRFFPALSACLYRIKKFQVFFEICPVEVWRPHAILIGGLTFNSRLLKITLFPTPTVFMLDTLKLDSSFLMKFRKNCGERIFKFTKVTPKVAPSSIHSCLTLVLITPILIAP